MRNRVCAELRCRAASTHRGANCKRFVVKPWRPSAFPRRNKSNDRGRGCCPAALPVRLLRHFLSVGDSAEKWATLPRTRVGMRWGGVGWGVSSGRVGTAAGGSQCLISGNLYKVMSRQRLPRPRETCKGQRSSAPGFVFIRAAVQGAAVMSRFGRRVLAC